jgi:hypothetical protein
VCCKPALAVFRAVADNDACGLPENVEGP